MLRANFMSGRSWNVAENVIKSRMELIDAFLKRGFMLRVLLNLKRGFLTRVPAAKLDSWIAHVCDALTVLLIAHVHAVRVPVAAPAQGDAEAVHPTLKLVGVTTSRRARRC